jgi:phosphoglycerate-specific signal transduction histidine kinase
VSDDRPRCEWVRDDIAAATTSMLRSIKSNADHHAHAERAARGRDTVYLMVSRLGNGMIRATAVAGLPEGHVLEVDGRDMAEVEFEARHLLLEIYHLVRLPGDTSREVRERVHATTIEVISGDP